MVPAPRLRQPHRLHEPEQQIWTSARSALSRRCVHLAENEAAGFRDWSAKAAGIAKRAARDTRTDRNFHPELRIDAAFCASGPCAAQFERPPDHKI
jgi:hypothetical protein